MSVNNHKPHIFVLPQDAANRQIANGFRKRLFSPQIRLLEPAGGWIRVLDRFAEAHVGTMKQFPHRFMILLIDFDSRHERLVDFKQKVPSDLVDRVFILGSLTEPEKLRSGWGSYEKIGEDLAEDCRAKTNKHWSHKLLRHNAPEFDRLREHVSPILFS